MEKTKIYFDNAATTPMDTEVISVITQVMNSTYGNPSSIHSFGREARVIIENSRREVAKIINASPSEILFTSGGTEAINTAINHCMQNGITSVITSRIEHHAVLHTLEKLESESKIKIDFVKISEKGEVDTKDLELLLQQNANSLVCLMHANNEIGTLLPIKEVSELCVKHNALFLCDTVQTLGKYPIDLKNIHIDFISCSAHKFHGPKGIGFLYVNGKHKLSPFIFGGGQERNNRSGTENIYGIVGLAKALLIATDNHVPNFEYITKLKNYFVSKLKSEFNSVSFNGTCENSGLYTIVNVSFPVNEKSEMLLFNIDIEGIAISGGSACSSGVINPSHVLNNINADLSMPAIRFSFSRYNTIEEIDFCIDVLKKHCKN
ncbi:MAG: cysteine desulfurase family protein [Bacteroidota bacterium]